MSLLQANNKSPKLRYQSFSAAFDKYDVEIFKKISKQEKLTQRQLFTDMLKAYLKDNNISLKQFDIQKEIFYEQQ